MKTAAPTHIGNLGKSFFVVLLALTITWAAVSYLIFQELYIARPILILNLIVAAPLGWLYYRYRYHTALSYDGESFTIRQGRSTEVKHAWSEFERASIIVLGVQRQAVRLYLKKAEAAAPEADDPEVIEIPATDLRLDVFAFRDEVSGYIRAAREK
jgi:hypothetical protein